MPEQQAEDPSESPSEHRAGRAKPRRRADIQGLRAVAVAMVVAFHAGIPPAGGYIGVDVFFVISGFVVGGVLLRELGQGSGLGFRTFYARRVRRLLPALALMSTVVALLSTVLLSPLTTQRTTAHTGIAASLFAANIQLANVPSAGYFGLASTTNALLHTWSLSVEEQFYLGFPALLAALWWFASRGAVDRVRRRLVILVLAGLAAVSFALSVATTFHPSERLGTSFAFYMAPSRAWEFAAGVLLALVAHRLTRLPAALAVGLGVVGAAVLAYGAITFDEATDFPGVAALVPVVGTLLLIVAGTATDRGLPQVLSLRPVVWIGDVSYGWYLWHWPLIVFAGVLWPEQDGVLVAAALLSLVPTALSYRYVENPIRFAPDAATRRVLPLMAVCILVPIAAFGALLAVGRVQRSTPTVERFEEAIREHEDRVRGCDVPLPLSERSEDCTWTVPDPKGAVYLVGDSNAGHFTEPVVAAGNAAGYDVTVAPTGGCPFADILRRPRVPGFFSGDVCRDAVAASLDTLIERKPSLVVVAMSSTEVVNDPTDAVEDPETGAIARTPEAKAEVYGSGLRRVLAELDEAGVPTVVVHTVPQFNETLGGSWRAETCPAIAIYLDRCDGSRSRRGVEAGQRLARTAEEQAVDGLDASTTLATEDVLCTETTCATSRDDLRLYRDSIHLSVDGAELLTPLFARAIEEQAVPGPVPD
ncbi:MAG: acyltransferase [Ilumatobacteraceae bacterium]|nr:acyltransferase [Ilumatobacteraceae bacterium]